MSLATGRPSFRRKRESTRWQTSASSIRSDPSAPVLFRRLAKDDFELHLVPLAEDRQGDSIARLMVAQGAEKVPVASYFVAAEGRDYVPLAHPASSVRTDSASRTSSSIMMGRCSS